MSDQVETKTFETFVADTEVVVAYIGKQILSVFTKEDKRPIHLQPEEVSKLASMIPNEFKS